MEFSLKSLWTTFSSGEVRSRRATPCILNLVFNAKDSSCDVSLEVNGDVIDLAHKDCLWMFTACTCGCCGIRERELRCEADKVETAKENFHTKYPMLKSVEVGSDVRQIGRIELAFQDGDILSVGFECYTKDHFRDFKTLYSSVEKLFNLVTCKSSGCNTRHSMPKKDDDAHVEADKRSFEEADRHMRELLGMEDAAHARSDRKRTKKKLGKADRSKSLNLAADFQRERPDTQVEDDSLPVHSPQDNSYEDKSNTLMEAKPRPLDRKRMKKKSDADRSKNAAEIQHEAPDAEVEDDNFASHGSQSNSCEDDSNTLVEAATFIDECTPVTQARAAADCNSKEISTNMELQAGLAPATAEDWTTVDRRKVSSTAPFEKGERLVIHGTSREDLNGLSGEAGAYDAKADRLVVTLGDGRQMRFRPANLRAEAPEAREVKEASRDPEVEGTAVAAHVETSKLREELCVCAVEKWRQAVADAVQQGDVVEQRETAASEAQVDAGKMEAAELEKPTSFAEDSAQQSDAATVASEADSSQLKAEVERLQQALADSVAQGQAAAREAQEQAAKMEAEMRKLTSAAEARAAAEAESIKLKVEVERLQEALADALEYNEAAASTAQTEITKLKAEVEQWQKAATNAADKGDASSIEAQPDRQQRLRRLPAPPKGPAPAPPPPPRPPKETRNVEVQTMAQQTMISRPWTALFQPSKESVDMHTQKEKYPIQAQFTGGMADGSMADADSADGKMADAKMADGNMADGNMADGTWVQRLGDYELDESTPAVVPMTIKPLVHRARCNLAPLGEPAKIERQKCCSMIGASLDLVTCGDGCRSSDGDSEVSTNCCREGCCDNEMLADLGPSPDEMESYSLAHEVGESVLCDLEI
mmetsp:Transcript_27250/g.49685  ORF Transcript_27250/g.49685 Transcript_27250/m.49685 type:complete len:877 (+) Transcript_27250:58-2688(+)